MRYFKFVLFSAIAILTTAENAIAASFKGIEFLQGEISFADSVIDYQPGYGTGYTEFEYALGVPDYTRRCGGCDYVSLGKGGVLTVKFTDNYLIGSGDAGLDLWVFEIGAAVEGTFVEISKDGRNWFDVGKVEGSTSGIDIDAFGFGRQDFFSYVRLIDDINAKYGWSAPSAGADIDAIGAISSIAVSQVPEPSGLIGLLSLGVFSLWAKFRAAR